MIQSQTKISLGKTFMRGINHGGENPRGDFSGMSSFRGSFVPAEDFSHKRNSLEGGFFIRILEKTFKGKFARARINCIPKTSMLLQLVS